MYLSPALKPCQTNGYRLATDDFSLLLLNRAFPHPQIGPLSSLGFGGMPPAAVAGPGCCPLRSGEGSPIWSSSEIAQPNLPWKDGTPCPASAQTGLERDMSFRQRGTKTPPLSPRRHRSHLRADGCAELALANCSLLAGAKPDMRPGAAGRSEEAEEAELSREGEPGASGSSQQDRQEAPCLQEPEMSSVRFVWFISECDFLSCVLSHLKVEAKCTRRGRGHRGRMPSSGEMFLWTNTSYFPGTLRC